MSLLQKKKDFEQYFLNNYSTTDIHWAGMKWDINAHTEWVYFEYRGKSVKTSGLSNTEYTHDGVVVLTVVAPTMFRCNEIADVALALFQGKETSEMFMENVNIMSQGTFDDNANSYIDLELRFYMV